MPDEDRPGGTHSSPHDANGYGRRHRRAAEEPPEKPRRRRRSMEDGPGGLSVADLVQRHATSGQTPAPVDPGAPGRRALPSTGQTSSRRRPAEGQPGRSGGRPGEAAGGQPWPDQGARQEQSSRRVQPGQATGRRVQPDPQGFPPAEPPATGRRALPDSYDLPQAPSAGRRALPEDQGIPDERPAPPGHRSGSYPVPRGQRSGGHALPPGQATGRRALPDDGYGPAARRVTPESGYGPAGGPGFAPGAPDDGYGPDNGYGPGGPEHGYGPGPDNGFGSGPDDGYAPGDNGFGPGDNGFGPADNGFGPGDNGFGPGDNGFGPGDNGYGRGDRGGDRGFGPGVAGGDGFGGRRPAADPGFGPADNGYGPADNGYGQADPGYGPADNGFGPADPGYGPADNGYGPADNGYGPADNGYGPGAADGFGPGPADNGFGPGPAHGGLGGRGAADNGMGGGRGPADNGFGAGGANGFGPGVAGNEGFGPGGAPGEGGFGPGGPGGGFGPADNGYGPGGPADNGYGPGGPADNGFGPGGAPDNGFGPGGPHEGFGPGQGTGRRPMPPNGFGPGQESGPRPGLPPGLGSGPHPMPGQNSGGRAFSPGPGQNTGAHPLPPAPGQSSGFHAVPPAGPPNAGPVHHLSGPIPRDPNAAGPNVHLSGPIPRDPNAARPGEERPSLPGSRAGADDRPQEPGKKVPLPPPRNPEDAISMTTEMEAIGEDVQKRRGIDHTLARFSAVHDELQAEERERKAKRRKLMPWRKDDDGEMDQLDELVAQQTLNAPPPKPQQPTPPAEPPELAELRADGGGGGNSGGNSGGNGGGNGGGGGATRLRDAKPRHNRSTLAIRVAAATAAILVFVATGIAWGFKSWVDASSQQVDALDPNSKDIQDAAKQRGDENFLLVGSDTRAGAEAEDGVGDEKEVVGARSDTVMIAHIPKDRERAVVVSFPRDLEVRRPACEGWDPKSGDYTGQQKPAAEQVKLNTAYQVGGPKCVTKMVQQLSGLMINHFVGIDFHGFKGMVDAVRGVQVCVEEPLKDDVLGTIVPQGGKNVTISGDQALNFVRARHVQGDLTSDYGRIKRQQRFLSSLLRKAMSSEVLLDPSKLTNFVQAFSKSTFGDNIGIDQMITLGQSLQGIAAGKVTFITVPTVGEANDNGNEDLRVEDTKSLFRAIREDTPLPGESGGTQQLQSGLALEKQGPVDPKTIKLQVLNGGNPTGGIAGSTADQLADFGYQIVQVDAAPENVKNTVIKYAKGRADQAQTLKASVPDAELVEDPSLVGAIQLIIGPGFDGKVLAPGKGKPAPDLPDDLSTVNGGDVSCA